MESQPMDTVDTINEVKYVTLDGAVGTIEADESQLEYLDEVTRRVAMGEFHKPVTGKIPKECMDGRPGGEMAPNSAGGTFSLTVADDLTTQRFSRGKTLVEADREVSKVVQGEGEPVGGHCTHTASGEKCGCGAKDEIMPIYGMIEDNPSLIREAVESLGIYVTDAVHNLIVKNAKARTAFPTGAELSASLKDVAGIEAESVLSGPHKEVVAAVNGIEGTSLDRQAFAEVFGDNYQAFNIDSWAFKEAAAAISLSEEETEMKVVALAYYNVAAAFILCGPGMRVVPVAA